MQPGAVVVAPEEQRHRGHGGADDQLAALADHLVPVLVERRGVDAELAAGDLALDDLLPRAALDDPAADVGAAAADEQQDVGPNSAATHR